MKIFIALFAVLAVVAAYPYEDPWAQQAWQQQSAWQKPIVVKSDPWQQSGWQPSVWPQQSAWPQQSVWPQQSAWPQQSVWPQQSHGWQQKHVQHVDAIHVNQPHPIPPLHPHPLKLHGNDHVTHIHYAKPHLPHPHLIGYEVEVKEPEVKHIIKPAHGWA